MADVEQLVDEARRSGLPVTLEVSEDRHPLPATLDLAAYRIVQEGLTNVRKHAKDAHAHVRILYEPNQIRVEVYDNGGGTSNPAAVGGHGLLGIRERVTLLGGSVDARPEPDGGFAVRVRLPLAQP